MNNKKTVARVIHLILIAIGLAIYVLSIVHHFQIGATAFYIIKTLLNFAALLAAGVYFLKGYHKEASGYFKAFMWIMVIQQVFEKAYIFSLVTLPFLYCFLNVLEVALFILLAGAKDYGKKLSLLISICLLVVAIILLLTGLSVRGAADSDGLFMMLDAIGQLIIAINVSFMVCGKYFDKAERGTK